MLINTNPRDTKLISISKNEDNSSLENALPHAALAMEELSILLLILQHFDNRNELALSSESRLFCSKKRGK